MKNDFDKRFGFVLNDVARLLRLSFDRQSQGLGLTRAQWSVLAHLHRLDGTKQNTLAALMDITPITLVRHLDRLEADGWVDRRNDPSDRRAKNVYLTAKAKPMIQTLQKLGQKVRKQALQGVHKEEEALFMDILLRIRANLGDDNGTGESSSD